MITEVYFYVEKLLSFKVKVNIIKLFFVVRIVVSYVLQIELPNVKII